MTKVSSGSEVICTIDPPDIRRVYSPDELEQIKCDVVLLFLIKQKTILNPESQREIIQSFPYLPPYAASSLVHSKPAWIFFNEVTPMTPFGYVIPHHFYGQRN